MKYIILAFLFYFSTGYAQTLSQNELNKIVENKVKDIELINHIKANFDNNGKVDNVYLLRCNNDKYCPDSEQDVLIYQLNGHYFYNFKLIGDGFPFISEFSVKQKELFLAFNYGANSCCTVSAEFAFQTDNLYLVTLKEYRSRVTQAGYERENKLFYQPELHSLDKVSLFELLHNDL